MKALLGIIVAVLVLGTPAKAETVIYEEPEITMEEMNDGENPDRSEEFMWFYRYYEGRYQKRLWSITYGHWVTDWIDCE